jgi:hypothetical protein
VVKIHNGILFIIYNEIPTCVAKWIDLEDIILSGVRQMKKDDYHIFSLLCGSKQQQKVDLIVKEQLLEFGKGWE